MARSEADRACEAALSADTTTHSAGENLEAMTEENMAAIAEDYQEGKAEEEISPVEKPPSRTPLRDWSKDSAKALNDKWKVLSVSMQAEEEEKTVSTFELQTSLFLWSRLPGIGISLLHWNVDSLPKLEGGEIQLSAPLFDLAEPF